MTKKWYGSKIKLCQMCNHEFKIPESFIDGRIRGTSTWAILCVVCHENHGVGLGKGKGQMYDFGTYDKIKG